MVRPTVRGCDGAMVRPTVRGCDGATARSHRARARHPCLWVL